RRSPRPTPWRRSRPAARSRPGGGSGRGVRGRGRGRRSPVHPTYPAERFRQPRRKAIQGQLTRRDRPVPGENLDVRMPDEVLDLGHVIEGEWPETELTELVHGW